MFLCLVIDNNNNNKTSYTSYIKLAKTLLTGALVSFLLIHV